MKLNKAIVHEMTELELKEYLLSIKNKIKKSLPYNVVQPIFYKGTKQDYLSELYQIKWIIKRELRKRKKEKLLKKLVILIKD